MTQIDALIDKVNKKLGSEVLTYATKLQTFQRVTTGSLSFDLALGGGWPLNTWNEIIGLESHGKTVIALKTIAANMALDPNYNVLWIASEQFNKDWAVTLGVDPGRLVLARTNVMETAYGIMIQALDDQSFDAIILDSYPALVPTIETENEMYDPIVAVGARLTNRLMRVSTPVMSRDEGERNCLCLIINQWRDTITAFGDPRTTPGGKGKNFACFTRVDVVRDGWLEAPGKVRVGQIIKIRTIKNKTAPPLQVAQTNFYFSNHYPFSAGDYDTVSDVCNIALVHEIISRGGAWFYYGDQKWNGREAVLQALREDLDLQREIDSQVRKIAIEGIHAPVPTPPTTKPRRRKKA